MRMLGPALPSPDTDATSSSGTLPAGRAKRSPGRVPTHIAVVMDGNGRWAEQRGLPRSSGHQDATRRVFEVIDGALQEGVRYLSVFAFSTENWHRSREEVTELLTCLEESARRHIDRAQRSGPCHQPQSRAFIQVKPVVLAPLEIAYL